MKLTEEQIKKNRNKMEESIGFAKLDNGATLSESDLELLDRIARGEITPDEAQEIFLSPDYKG